jgi:THO complex subunit 1
MVSILECDAFLLILGEVFDLFESRAEAFRPLYKTKAGTRFLRTNIALLSRFSQSANVHLKGRILLFLAAGIPISDRSGVNRRGDCNKENVTEFETELPDDMNLAPGDSRPIDFKFYRTFWSLQSYFQNPLAVVSSGETFSSFFVAAMEVINAFAGWPIRRAQTGPKPSEGAMEVDEEEGEVRSVLSGCPPYFKYLTSTRLLSLQTGDAHFQRQVLVQFSILIHAMQSSYVDKLNEQQVATLVKLKRKVDSALEEGHGKDFSSLVQRSLATEKYWIKWKKDGCPSFEKEPANTINPSAKALTPPQSKGEKPWDLGVPALSSIWNFSEDNDCIDTSVSGSPPAPLLEGPNVSPRLSNQQHNSS